MFNIKLLNQDLINYIAQQLKAGHDYIKIQAWLLRSSSYKTKEITEAFYLVRFIGAENIHGDEVERLKKDRSFLKDLSGLTKYFNIVASYFLFLAILDICVIYHFFSINLQLNISTILGIISLVLLLITAFGFYRAERWGWVLVASFIFFVFFSIYGVFGRLILNLVYFIFKGGYLQFILDLILVVYFLIMFSSMLKILEKMYGIEHFSKRKKFIWITLIIVFLVMIGINVFLMLYV